MRVALVGAAGVLVASVGLTAASASVPDSSGTIHACYTTSSGALRVIDTDNSGSCYSYETAISWPSSVPSLKSFTGVTAKDSNGDVTVSCPDSGVPVSLWLSSYSSGGVGTNNSMDIAGAGSSAFQQLTFPGGDTTKPPNGLQANASWIPSGNLNYTIICS